MQSGVDIVEGFDSRNTFIDPEFSTYKNVFVVLMDLSGERAISQNDLMEFVLVKYLMKQKRSDCINFLKEKSVFHDDYDESLVVPLDYLLSTVLNWQTIILLCVQDVKFSGTDISSQEWLKKFNECKNAVQQMFVNL
jgi:hypothetical protein